MGHEIRCVVTRPLQDGSLSFDPVTVYKHRAPAIPSGLAGVAPSVRGGSDGKITGTTSAMEYSTDFNFTDAQPCKEDETTGLAAGAYYVRYAETATTSKSNYSTVTVPEGLELPEVKYLVSEDATWYYGALADVWETASEIVLQSDVTVNANLECNNTLTLDLNGHVLDLNGHQIKINASGDLTLKDSNTDGLSHKFIEGTCTAGSCWYPDENGDHTVEGGIIISRVTYENQTIGLYNRGSLKLDGGNIVGCDYGITNSDSFDVNGDNIIGNPYGLNHENRYSVINGGNIRFNSVGVGATIGTSVEMNGGSISDNTFGVQSSGSFVMGSGSIENNTIGVVNDGSFTVNGGSIQGNTDFAVRNYDSFTVNGGSIQGTILNRDHANISEGDIFNQTTCNPHV